MSESTQWDMEGEAKSMLQTLGIVRLDQKISELSGGQRKRLALAEILMQPCDILVLDEPTNHLDHAMAAWLEDYLKRWRGSLIMVTHDRYFLGQRVQPDRGDRQRKNLQLRYELFRISGAESPERGDGSGQLNGNASRSYG